MTIIKKILSLTKAKYISSEEFFNKIQINRILKNLKSEINSKYIEFKTFNSTSEKLKRFYKKTEIYQRLKALLNYYFVTTQIFPNYLILTENYFLYKNIKEKQDLLDQEINNFKINQFNNKKENRNNKLFTKNIIVDIQNYIKKEKDDDSLFSQLNNSIYQKKEIKNDLINESKESIENILKILNNNTINVDDLRKNFIEDSKQKNNENKIKSKSKQFIYYNIRKTKKELIINNSKEKVFNAYSNYKKNIVKNKSIIKNKTSFGETKSINEKSKSPIKKNLKSFSTITAQNKNFNSYKIKKREVNIFKEIKDKLNSNKNKIKNIKTEKRTKSYNKYFSNIQNNGYTERKKSIPNKNEKLCKSEREKVKKINFPIEKLISERIIKFKNNNNQMKYNITSSSYCIGRNNYNNLIRKNKSINQDYLLSKSFKNFITDYTKISENSNKIIYNTIDEEKNKNFFQNYNTINIDSQKSNIQNQKNFTIKVNRNIFLTNMRNKIKEKNKGK